MGTTKHALQEDALDGWLSDLTDGETSMRKLRKKLAAKAEARTPAADEDECPTCHGAGHTGSILRAIS
ncbi:hypothetical protein [Modestobacter sp. NPDC049651]|uniref:hypothetical protein n=1 Tax=unclassified Modestobacter TaxID=2643866 RepID=UPI0033DD1B85